MKPAELIRKFNKVSGLTSTFYVNIKKVDAKEQIAYGEVYAPYIIDTHGDMMLPDAVKQLAHRWLADNPKVDIMHDNKWIEAYPVESFIARDGDPDFNDGAWVLATKHPDKQVWNRIEVGELNGYSIEAYVYPEDSVEVEISVQNHVFGFTEENDGHSHGFFVEIDGDGRVVRGVTSVADDGHWHELIYGTATELAGFGTKHGHRIFLP